MEPFLGRHLLTSFEKSPRPRVAVVDMGVWGSELCIVLERSHFALDHHGLVWTMSDMTLKLAGTCVPSHLGPIF